MDLDGRSRPAGALLQFPFYGGIGFMLTKVVNADKYSRSDSIAH